MGRNGIGKLLDAIEKSGAKVTPSQIRTQIYELGFNQDKWNRSMIKTRLWRANNLPPTKKYFAIIIYALICII